jgi:hypothetical protein
MVGLVVDQLVLVLLLLRNQVQVVVFENRLTFVHSLRVLLLPKHCLWIKNVGFTCHVMLLTLQLKHFVRLCLMRLGLVGHVNEFFK